MDRFVIENDLVSRIKKWFSVKNSSADRVDREGTSGGSDIQISSLRGVVSGELPFANREVRKNEKLDMR